MYTSCISPQYVIVSDFLSDSDHCELLESPATADACFAASCVVGEAMRRPRRSRVRDDFPLPAAFHEYLPLTLEQVCGQLGIPLFTTGSVECQLTAHNEGDYFGLHNDAGSKRMVCTVAGIGSWMWCRKTTASCSSRGTVTTRFGPSVARRAALLTHVSPSMGGFAALKTEVRYRPADSGGHWLPGPMPERSPVQECVSIISATEQLLDRSDIPRDVMPRRQQT